jgi:uncharacterized membrane protein
MTDPTPPRTTTRLLPLDWLRGLVMVLMAVDHADGRFAATHVFTDSAWLYGGEPLPAGPFLTRWLTHMCAPTFLFLVGAGVALSARGDVSPRAQDRHLLVRGLLLMALDPLWMWSAFGEGGVGVQVLFAIGASLVALIGLRRVPPRWLLCGALAWYVLGEAIIGLAMHLLPPGRGGMPPAPVAFLLTGGAVGPVFVAYPLIPWLSMAALGLVFGHGLKARGAAWGARTLARAGIVLLACFAVVRAVNGYGNMQLLRTDGSLTQWLHVSKYPPSLSFVSLEIGLMALLLAFFFAARDRLAFGARHPLTVFGQCALPFYLVHVHVLFLFSLAIGMSRSGHLGHTYLATAALLLVLYPFCLWVRARKQRHPHSLLRYL